MGLFKRAATVVESRVNKLLDKLEDPNATLDLSYEKMIDGLQEMKASLADVVTEQKQLEVQIARVERDMAEREEEAKTALKMGREDLAQAALERKHQLSSQLEPLQQALERITAQAERLKDAERKLEDRIHAFKTQKEVTKATYNASKAEVKVGESMSGISKSFGGVGDSLQRAQDKAEQMQARAAAMESLAEEGILEDPLDKRDKVQKELDQIKQQSAVQDDLERLKKEMENKQ